MGLSVPEPYGTEEKRTDENPKNFNFDCLLFVGAGRLCTGCPASPHRTTNRHTVANRNTTANGYTHANGNPHPCSGRLEVDLE
jgi:hypothetical protein